ncbi:glycosyltransferase family 4 protein [Winogradskyella ursingii]|uniref:glycosyltransferase family 4 protein n=1 Tax=Winogradskyella ursingii TaxID=2686079 RepID=UPI0015CC4CCE|nr:glycosyltransferase [Winogradskyella ursingii]
MKFLIISHAFHQQQNGKLFSYAPYVREMNLWLKYVKEVEIVAPLDLKSPGKIDLDYKHENLHFNRVPPVNFMSLSKTISSLFSIPIILFKLIGACRRADHIHLRCPGNIGLLGCVVQVCFPNKTKTAKYAGNWDPNSNQPLSYRFQKWLLSNTFLTKNMTVLVYGNWPNQSENIKSFFTATFKNSEKTEWNKRDYSNQLNFVFIGSLVNGKRPLLAIKIVHALQSSGQTVKLDVFGEGILKEELAAFITENKLESLVTLHGNQSTEVIKNYLEKAHFSILPSQSEGWPKAITEAMFFGVIPIATRVSCVPWILDHENRGVLIDSKIEEAVEKIVAVLNERNLHKMSKEAQGWSQVYTLDKFDEDIRKLLIS